jgi:trehalose 6-phosphate phosphatase
MKHALKDWKNVSELIKNKTPYLFLDYDGTLAPIRKKPHLAVLSKSNKAILKKLSQNENIKTHIVTGRDMSFIKKTIPLKNVTYATNHGFEIKGPKINYAIKLKKDYLKTLKDIARKLNDKKNDFPKTAMENKKFSMAVHYRLLDDKLTKRFLNFIKRVLSPYKRKNKIKVKVGKRVVEIMPPINWNKGKAVEYLLKKSKLENIMPIYLGDDKTDEDAFKALKNKGISVFVGPKGKNAYAKYFLKNTCEVYALLKNLLKI